MTWVWIWAAASEKVNLCVNACLGIIACVFMRVCYRTMCLGPFQQWLTGEQWSLTAHCWDSLTTQRTLLDTHWHTHTNTLTVARRHKESGQYNTHTHTEQREDISLSWSRKPVLSLSVNYNKRRSLCRQISDEHLFCQLNLTRKTEDAYNEFCSLSASNVSLRRQKEGK